MSSGVKGQGRVVLLELRFAVVFPLCEVGVKGPDIVFVQHVEVH